MVQTLYGILAMSMLALLTLTLNNSIHSNDQEMMMNEISSHVTGMADELFDEISGLSYDSATLSDQNLVTRDVLSDEETFGTENCEPENNFSGCWVMNDLHGATMEHTVGGITYHMEISLRYVDESDPTQDSSTPTFSKMAEIRISSPDLYIGSSSNPLTVVLDRLYNYPRVTG